MTKISKAQMRRLMSVGSKWKVHWPWAPNKPAQERTILSWHSWGALVGRTNGRTPSRFTIDPTDTIEGDESGAISIVEHYRDIPNVVMVYTPEVEES